MKLTNRALTIINTPKTRVKIAAALGYTEQWIMKLIKDNKENGTLTTVKAMRVILKETGLKQSEVLTEVEVTN
jgi:predicted transcriptional regulator